MNNNDNNQIINENEDERPIKKTLLSKQKKLITVLAVAALIFAVAYFAFDLIFRPELVSVPLVNEKGDMVEVYVIDNETGKNILPQLEAMMNGETENLYYVKKGDGKKTHLTFRKENVEVKTFPYIFPEIQAEDVSSVTVTNPFGTFAVKYMNGSPYVVGAENNLYNGYNLSSLMTNSLFMLSDGYVENPGDLDQYYLGESTTLATIEILEKDGKKTKVLLGNMLSDGRFYMKHADKDSVYLMDSGAIAFLSSVKDFLSAAVVKPISQQESYYMDSFSINKNGQPFFGCKILSDEEKKGVYINQRHVMTYPEQKYVLDTGSVYQMFEVAASLSGDSVVEYGVSSLENKDEVFAAYGLDIPLYEVSFSYKGTAQSFSVGSLTSDGIYNYVYSPYQDTIVVVKNETVSVFDKELIDLYEENVFQYSIDNISSLELGYDGRNYSYVLSGTGKELTVKEQTTGRDIDVASFRRMYMSVLGINIGGYSSFEGSVEGKDSFLTVSATLRSGEKLIYEFYSTSAVNCYMIVDGKGGFETDKRNLEAIINKSNMLIEGVEIPLEF